MQLDIQPRSLHVAIRSPSERHREASAGPSHHHPLPLVHDTPHPAARTSGALLLPTFTRDRPQSSRAINTRRTVSLHTITPNAAMCALSAAHAIPPPRLPSHANAHDQLDATLTVGVLVTTLCPACKSHPRILGPLNPRPICVLRFLTGSSSSAFTGSMFSLGQTAANNRFPCSKLKLDNLFLQWLSGTDSQQLVRPAPPHKPTHPPDTCPLPACLPSLKQCVLASSSTGHHRPIQVPISRKAAGISGKVTRFHQCFSVHLPSLATSEPREEGGCCLPASWRTTPVHRRTHPGLFEVIGGPMKRLAILVGEAINRRVDGHFWQPCPPTLPVLHLRPPACIAAWS